MILVMQYLRLDRETTLCYSLLLLSNLGSDITWPLCEMTDICSLKTLLCAGVHPEVAEKLVLDEVQFISSIGPDTSGIS